MSKFINRNKVLSVISKDITKVVTAGFIKKSGEYRIMTFNVAPAANPYVVHADNGYVTVYDRVISEYRTINLDSINFLVIDSKLYRIKG